MGGTQLIGVPIIIAILVASGASTIYMDSSEDFDQDVEKIVNDAVKDITTYVEILDVIGRYMGMGEKRELDRILILAKLPFDGSINASDLRICVDDGKRLIILGYSGFATFQKSDSLFDNAVWSEGFSLIVILDRDSSICEWGVINHGDIFFIAVELPSSFHIRAGDNLVIYIVVPSGVTKTLDIYVPFSCSSDIILLGW